MSELKDYDIMDIETMDDERLEKSESGKIQATRVYLKSEADKVIAEKDKEIQRLENLCESYRIDCDKLAIREANACKEIERDNKQLRHQKYKRCLDKAKYCKAEQTFSSFAIYITEHPELRWSNKSVGAGNWIAFWKNRERRWLELAEQFKDKEAK